MKPTIPLRQENQEFDNEGLGSRMDKFFGDDPVPDPTPDPASIEPDKPESKVSANFGGDDGEEEEEEEQFPELGSTKPVETESDDPSDFDEAKFDKETEDEVKALDAKAGEKWKALKAQVKEFRKQAEEAKQAATKSKPNPEQEREIAELREKALEAEALKKRVEELVKVNDRVAVEESIEYKEKVTQPYSEMQGILTSLSEHSKIPLNTLINIVTENDVAKQDAMLEEIEEKVSGRMASRISRIADDYKAVTHTKAKLIENASKTLEASRISQAKATEEEKARVSQAFKISSQESFTNYASKIPSFTDSTGNLTDLAKDIMHKTASIDPSTLNASDLGYMAFCANSFPEARKEIVRLQKEIKMLKVSKGDTSPISGSAGKRSDPEPDNLGLSEKMKGMEFTFSGA